jgi:hypothetical protein
MRVNRNRLIIACLFIGLGLMLTVSNWDPVKQQIGEVQVSGIQLGMTRLEVEKLHGEGPDRTPGCFGCEMNIIYPHLNVSGRYSETKGKKAGGRRSPIVKQLTIADPNVDILGMRIGDSIGNAARTLKSKGFRLQTDRNQHFYHFYFKDDLYIRLWPDSELNHFHKDREHLGQYNDTLGSITIEIRVKDDEQIQY